MCNCILLYQHHNYGTITHYTTQLNSGVREKLNHMYIDYMEIILANIISIQLHVTITLHVLINTPQLYTPALVANFKNRLIIQLKGDPRKSQIKTTHTLATYS